MKIYFLFQYHAFWIGAHYSAFNKRICINLIPMFTICIVFKNGISPLKVEKAL